MTDMTSTTLKQQATVWNTTRKEWQPNQPAKNSDYCLAPNTISRCLSLTPLEPLVKGFILEGLDRSDHNVLGADAIAALLRNTEDEVKHELALDNAKQSLVDYNSKFEDEALQFIKAWNLLDDHPITKAAVLENGVFFVMLPLYATFGSAALRITANSISADEVIHVQTHRAAAQLLKARPSKQLDQLRIDTVAWLSSSLDETDGKWTKQRALKNSDSLMKRGVSDMMETAVATVLAPYELKSTSLDVYA
jgi:hypothetical protein